MDATCNVQDSIHVFHLVHNMCPGFWVHIISPERFFESDFLSERKNSVKGLLFFLLTSQEEAA